MYLSTDNATSRAALFIGNNNITRIEPEPQVSEIELDDWQSAVKSLPDAAYSNFIEYKEKVSAFFKEPADKRDFFCKFE